MAVGRITQMGYVALRTRDLTASIRNATEVFGLQLTENDGRKAFLAAADTHHELVYIQDESDTADHFGVIAPDAEELDAIRAKVDRAGYRIVSEQPIEDHIEHGFAFVGPEGYTWQVYTPVPWIDRRLGGVGPDRYGHINIRALDSVAMTRFLIDVFDMRVSDRIGEDAAFFLRCNTEHHAVAVAKSDRTALHHHAWLTQSITDLGRLGDRLARQGRRLLWGPLRHGAGHNIAAYFVEPNGTVVELYTDMEHIYDPEREPTLWSSDDLYWINQWDGMIPPTVRSFGTVPFER
ncbi:MAG TPA: VOC family protein [Microbacteriaceae bacterium]|nr:VOC family protein [Microbacteriaceae bacterium]